MSRPARHPVLAVLAALVLLLCGCTYARGGEQGATTADATRVATGGLTGAPLTIGLVTQENSPTGSVPESRVAAIAAASLAHRTMQGVAGRPIAVRTCRTDGSPESSQQCARELLAAAPVAVVGGVDLGAAAALPQYAAAGVPYVTGSPQLLPELSSPDSFALTGGTAAELLGTVSSLTDAGATRISALYVDLPGLLATAAQVTAQALAKKGVSAQLVAEKADAADFTPALTSAAAGNPNAILIVFPPTACARILQAAAGLSLTVPLYLPGGCATPDVLRFAGSLQVRFATGYELVPPTGGSPDVAAFRRAVPIADRTPEAQASWSTLLVLRSLLARTAPADTSARLIAELQSVQDEPAPMAHPFTCDHRLFLVTSVCNTSVRLLAWRDGRLQDVTGSWVDGSALIPLLLS